MVGLCHLQVLSEEYPRPQTGDRVTNGITSTGFDQSYLISFKILRQQLDKADFFHARQRVNFGQYFEDTTNPPEIIVDSITSPAPSSISQPHGHSNLGSEKGTRRTRLFSAHELGIRVACGRDSYPKRNHRKIRVTTVFVLFVPFFLSPSPVRPLRFPSHTSPAA